jgi:hypothetical protein
LIIRRFLFLSLVALLPGAVWADQPAVIQTDEVIVVFEESLRPAAQEVVDIHGKVKQELETMLGLDLDFRPKVLLVPDRERFVKMVGSDLFVAFAAPEQQLVVIDYTRMTTDPFTLRTTLKHELCHLILHRHIDRDRLPTWLDEGVAQWTSEGIAEIIMDGKRSILRQATLSGNYIRMAELADGFPRDRRALMLAYEESRSFVEYVSREFGHDGIVGLLEALARGDDVDTAFVTTLSVSLEELEARWYRDLRRRTTWLTYLTANLYGILFFLAALITIGGFIRVMIKKRRRYAEEEERLAE